MQEQEGGRRERHGCVPLHPCNTVPRWLHMVAPHGAAALKQRTPSCCRAQSLAVHHVPAVQPAARHTRCAPSPGARRSGDPTAISHLPLPPSLPHNAVNPSRRALRLWLAATCCSLATPGNPNTLRPRPTPLAVHPAPAAHAAVHSSHLVLCGHHPHFLNGAHLPLWFPNCLPLKPSAASPLPA